MLALEKDASPAANEADPSAHPELEESVTAKRLSWGSENRSRLFLIVEPTCFDLIEIHASLLSHSLGTERSGARSDKQTNLESRFSASKQLLQWARMWARTKSRPS